MRRTSGDSKEDLLHPFRLQPDVVRRGRFAAARGSGAEAPTASESAATIASSSSGSTRTPDSGVTNSGGPPTADATTERADAIASSVARPNGSERLGWQTTSEAAIHVGTSSWATRPDEADAGPSRERSAERPAADEGERALATPLERAREPQDVLALGEAAEAEEVRSLAAPAELVASRLGVPRREALEVDAAVDDLGLAVGLGHLRARGGRGASARRRSRRRPAARRSRVAARTPGIAPMFATSWPWAVTTSGARVASAAARPAGTRKCAYATSGWNRRATRRASRTSATWRLRPPAGVDDRALDLVSARRGARARGSRRRLRGPDPPAPGTSGRRAGCAGRYPRVTWRIPRHISSVVPSPQRT